jgi:uncharacterized hydrophobic protein (TIGR00271 family)
MFENKIFKLIQQLIRSFDISHEKEDFEKIHDDVERGIPFTGTNLWILMFAIVTASVGLNVNSTAVIIGAMLISPLMGPIIGIGYSVATYDFLMLKDSFKNFSYSVIVGLVASTVYFKISPINEAHSELLARTSPTSYDVLIAFAGGLAGIVAMSSKLKGNVIPGVAIATALMPPLCTAGYGLATGQWNFFFGAFYLFTINTVFIALATLLASRLQKFPVKEQANKELRAKANQWVTSVALLTLIPSIYFGYILIKKDDFARNAKSFIKYETYIEGDYLLNSEIDANTRIITLEYGGRPINEDQKNILKQKLNKYNIGNAQLNILLPLNIADESELNLIDKLNIEILNLKEEKNIFQEKIDSIRAVDDTGRHLFAEAEVIFPFINRMSVGNQFVFDKYEEPHKQYLVYVNTFGSNVKPEDIIRLEDWLKIRLNTDNILMTLD